MFDITLPKLIPIHEKGLKKEIKTKEKFDIKQYEEGPWSNGKTEYSQIKKSIRQIRRKFFVQIS
jgi:hypothetical protein